MYILNMSGQRFVRGEEGEGSRQSHEEALLFPYAFDTPSGPGIQIETLSRT